MLDQGRGECWCFRVVWWGCRQRRGCAEQRGLIPTISVTATTRGELLGFLLWLWQMGNGFAGVQRKLAGTGLQSSSLLQGSIAPLVLPFCSGSGRVPTCTGSCSQGPHQLPSPVPPQAPGTILALSPSRQKCCPLHWALLQSQEGSWWSQGGGIPRPACASALVF